MTPSETSSLPAEGEMAPDFTVLDDTGASVSLSSFRGKKVVLYFYPKDDTPGCTTQACDIRDNFGALRERGAVVLGVSPDSVAKHVKFRTKYDLPFTLLADTDHAVSEKYGVWGEKSFYGKKYMGVDRTTFVIDEEGRILKVFPKVKAEKHLQQVLEVL
jgi:peroxiredoxin Q/BCP